MSCLINNYYGCPAKCHVTVERFSLIDIMRLGCNDPVPWSNKTKTRVQPTVQQPIATLKISKLTCILSACLP